MIRPPALSAVRRQVQQILSSSSFDASRRSREFFHFVVEKTLAGHGEDLTQGEIALRVFGRREAFDPVLDPIVRIQAGRLRRSLERYYLLSGSEDTLRIELPRGTYVPAFRNQAMIQTAIPVASRPQEAVAAVDDWPALAIHTFEPTRAGAGAVAEHITEELAVELGQYQDVRSLLQPEGDPPEAPGRTRPRFSLGGRVWGEDGDLRVMARLVDRTTGEQVWGDEYHTAPGPGRWSGTPADIARVIACRVAADEGIVVQVLAAERRRGRPASITPYGAMLLSYEFFLTRDPQRLQAALDALRGVVEADPHLAVIWTRLGRVCFANHAFEVTPIPTPIDEAIGYALNGVRLDPSSRRGRCILAAALLVKDERAAAREELEEALRLGSDSLLYLEIIGMFLTVLGDRPRGPELIRSAKRRNPYFLPNAMMGLWLDHLQSGEIQLAYQDALQYRDPTFFLGTVMRASCLGLLGRGAEAAADVSELLRSKPDFAARGRTLIGYYVKNADVMGQIALGLAEAGLTLA